MTPERWQRVKEIFQEAQGHSSDRRAAFLDGACDGDETLRREVETLLAADEQSGSFMDRPAVSTSDLLSTGVGMSVAGQRLGNYRLEAPLGHGGMGIVFLARDSRLGRSVAVKLLQPHYTRDAERVRRFQQEARAASALNHPNILTIYETGEVDGAHFIATEFVEGKTLRELLSGGLPSFSTSFFRRPARFLRRTLRASSTATSNPKTSCCAPTAT
jgi:serine/threonine protein kinase